VVRLARTIGASAPALLVSDAGTSARIYDADGPVFN